MQTFTSERAVKILTERAREISTTRADKQMVEGIRNNIRKLTEGSGNPELKSLANLPDDLLRVLWTVDDQFIAGLTFRYEGNKEFDSDRNSPDDAFTAQGEDPLNGKDAVGYANKMQVRPLR